MDLFGRKFGGDAYEGRHDSLRLMAWLFSGWPQGTGPQVAQEVLRRWLYGDREFASFHLPSEWVGKDGPDSYEIGPEFRVRVRELYAGLALINPEPNPIRAIIATPRVTLLG
jgi:hypothetical protein